jgi:hypothetical protein
MLRFRLDLHLGDEVLERRSARTAAASRALATRSCEKKVGADPGGVVRSGGEVL